VASRFEAVSAQTDALRALVDQGDYAQAELVARQRDAALRLALVDGEALRAEERVLLESVMHSQALLLQQAQRARAACLSQIESLHRARAASKTYARRDS
jgi:hypothetical protein